MFNNNFEIISVISLYSIYSVVGYAHMVNYFRGCINNDKVPFNNSLLKLVAASILAGFITSSVVVIASVWEICKKLR